MLELWLIRHGETDWNREGRVQGQQHNPLSDLGERQSRRLGAWLEGEAFDTVYCSDLRRAVQTAELVFPGRALCFDPRLREIARGVLEGHLGTELVGEAQEVFAAIQRDLLGVRPPGGENGLELGARALAWFKSLPHAGKVAAVTHGGIIHALLHYTVGVEQARGWRFSASNTGVTRLRVQEGFITLLSVNDTAHLRPHADLRAP